MSFKVLQGRSAFISKQDDIPKEKEQAPAESPIAAQGSGTTKEAEHPEPPTPGMALRNIAAAPYLNQSQLLMLTGLQNTSDPSKDPLTNKEILQNIYHVPKENNAFDVALNSMTFVDGEQNKGLYLPPISDEVPGVFLSTTSPFHNPVELANPPLSVGMKAWLNAPSLGVTSNVENTSDGDAARFRAHVTEWYETNKDNLNLLTMGNAQDTALLAALLYTTEFLEYNHEQAGFGLRELHVLDEPIEKSSGDAIVDFLHGLEPRLARAYKRAYRAGVKDLEARRQTARAKEGTQVAEDYEKVDQIDNNSLYNLVQNGEGVCRNYVELFEGAAGVFADLTEATAPHKIEHITNIRENHIWSLDIRPILSTDDQAALMVSVFEPTIGDVVLSGEGLEEAEDIVFKALGYKDSRLAQALGVINHGTLAVENQLSGSAEYLIDSLSRLYFSFVEAELVDDDTDTSKIDDAIAQVCATALAMNLSEDYSQDQAVLLVEEYVEKQPMPYRLQIRSQMIGFFNDGGSELYWWDLRNKALGDRIRPLLEARQAADVQGIIDRATN